MWQATIARHCLCTREHVKDGVSTKAAEQATSLRISSEAGNKKRPLGMRQSKHLAGHARTSRNLPGVCQMARSSSPQAGRCLSWHCCRSSNRERVWCDGSRLPGGRSPPVSTRGSAVGVQSLQMSCQARPFPRRHKHRCCWAVTAFSVSRARLSCAISRRPPSVPRSSLTSHPTSLPAFLYIGL